MWTTGAALVVAEPDALERSVPAAPPVRQRPGGAGRWIGGVPVLVALTLNLWHLGRDGYGNLFYAAAVRSMTQSWHNFFFVSFDPGGFISVDKPPGALWLQALAARGFGYHPLALLVPGALAGAAAVAILFAAVRRVAGTAAALVAGMALATTPISVATNRSNNPDAVLALLLVTAGWALIRAAERGSLRWLVGAAVLVGLGFNTKMLAALLPLGGLWLAYLVTARPTLRTRVVHLLVASATVIAVSGAWIAAVDLSPPSSRPFVGGSTHNSEVDLTLRYNGVRRVSGAPPTGSRPPAAAEVRSPEEVAAAAEAVHFGDAGRHGIGRLISEPLGGQASWLLPLGACGLVAGLPEVRRRRRRDPWITGWIMWGTWLIVDVVVFSEAKGIFHGYYLSAMAPAAAASAGIGGVACAHAWRDRRPAGILLPVALVATGLLELHLVGSDDYLHWLGPVAAAATMTAAAASVVGMWALPRAVRRALALAIGCGAAVAAVAPVGWALTVPTRAGVFSNPVAGPSLLHEAQIGSTRREAARKAGEAAPAVTRPGGAATAALIGFLERHHDGERWALATHADSEAWAIIIRSGLAVAPLGGYSGRDPTLTIAQFRGLVDTGRLRYVLVPAAPGAPAPGETAASRIEASVRRLCAVVDPPLWGGPPAGPALYDCSPG